MISNFIFDFSNFCVMAIFFFLTKLLTLSILFLTELRVVVVAKLLILGISHLTSFILALGKALVAKSVISGILSLLFFI